MNMSFVRIIILWFFLIVLALNVASQRISGGLNYDFFFDNNEYDRSELAVSQTMSGMHLIPDLQFRLDKHTSLNTGANFLFTHGDHPHLSTLMPLVYLRHETKKQKVWVGTFPRSSTLNEYSDLLFQDSIRYFRPNINGFMWQLQQNRSFIKLWLDWTGKQGVDVRESFMAGFSFSMPLVDKLNFSGESYLFHLANTRPRTPGFVVCDNAQSEIRLSWTESFSKKENRLNLSAGLLAAYERERANPAGGSYPLSMVLRANYYGKIISSENVWIYGEPRMLHYEKYAESLYWSSPFLRDKSYFRSKLNLHLVQKRKWNLTVGSHMHWSQGKLLFQQVMTVSAGIDRITLLK